MCVCVFFSQMLAADEALVVKAGGPALVRLRLSAGVYSGKAVIILFICGVPITGRGFWRPWVRPKCGGMTPPPPTHKTNLVVAGRVSMITPPGPRTRVGLGA